MSVPLPGAFVFNGRFAGAEDGLLIQILSVRSRQRSPREDVMGASPMGGYTKEQFKQYWSGHDFDFLGSLRCTICGMGLAEAEESVDTC